MLTFLSNMASMHSCIWSYNGSHNTSEITTQCRNSRVCRLQNLNLAQNLVICEGVNKACTQLHSNMDII